MKKKIVLLLALVLFELSSSTNSVFAQTSGTGVNGLAIGSTTNNTYSALVLKGANLPYLEASKRDILFSFNNAGTSGIRAYRGTEWGSYLQFMTSQPGVEGGIPQVRLHIDQYGFIGIGTTSPTQKLDINGMIKTKGILSDGDMRFGTNVPIGSCGYRLWFAHESDNTDPMFITRFNKAQDESELRINLGDWADARDKFCIGYTGIDDSKYNSMFTVQADGKVGILTNTPQNALDVNGIIRAKEIKVESGWADFVFKKDYKLPTLNEVKKHIDEKGTLPGVPSEADVKANGVGLGEVNAILLQKIEELTLYVIKQQEEINELKELIKNNSYEKY